MNSINSLLLFVGLSENEIKTVFERNDKINSANFDLVYENLQTLVNSGFPEDDLNFIIYNSPRFLTYSTTMLNTKLIKLRTKENWVENLKENPETL